MIIIVLLFLLDSRTTRVLKSYIENARGSIKAKSSILYMGGNYLNEKWSIRAVAKGDFDTGYLSLSYTPTAFWYLLIDQIVDFEL